MFSYFKHRKQDLAARTLIKVALQGQINDAFEQNESLVSERLNSVFFVGYTWYFTRICFTNLNLRSGGEPAEKHIKFILKSEHFGEQLVGTFFRQMSAIEIAKTFEDQNKIIIGQNFSPAEMMRLFEDGSHAGMADAVRMGDASLLKQYLLNKLDFNDIPKC